MNTGVIISVILGLLALIVGGGAIYWFLIRNPFKKITNHFMDANGGDISLLVNKTLDDCEKACLKDSKCTSFVRTTDNNECYLRNKKAGLPYGASGWDSYIRKSMYEL